MSTDRDLLYLSRADVEGLGLTAVETVDQIEHLCRERDAGRVLNAPKSLLRPVDEVLFMTTLAVSEDPPYTALKALGVKTQTKVELSALQIHSAETGVPEGSKGSADGGTRRSQRLYINESA